MAELLVISPATTMVPVVRRVSQATRDSGSPASAASTTASEIWSAILSGCPSVTDSLVKRNPLLMLVSWATGACLSPKTSDLAGNQFAVPAMPATPLDAVTGAGDTCACGAASAPMSG